MTPMATPNSERLLGVITDDDVAALDARNRQRARQAILRMGARHCLHGANSPQRAAPVRLRRATDWPAVEWGRKMSQEEFAHQYLLDPSPSPLPRTLGDILRGVKRGA